MSESSPLLPGAFLADVPQRATAILLAAGSSTRMAVPREGGGAVAGGVEKTWLMLAGRPLIAHSLAAFASVEAVTSIVVVAPAARHTDIATLSATIPGCPPLACVEGGARRQDSVAAGLAAAPDAEWYLVHDAARPLVTAEVITRALEAARRTGVAIPAVPVVDTIKVASTGELVEATLERAQLRAVQTPQAFHGPLLRRAHTEVSEDVTDDAAMVERLGVAVVLSEGDATNIKVTTPPDLAIAQALFDLRSATGAGDEA